MNVELKSIEELASLYRLYGHPSIMSELLKKSREIIKEKVSRYSKDSSTTDDLTQEILIKTFIHFDLFKGNSKYQTWIYSIVHNTCLSYIKENNKKVNVKINSALIDSLQDEMDEDIDGSLTSLKDSELEEIISILLTQLNEKEKALFLLRFKDQHSIKELMTITGQNESSVKMQIKRIKDKLAKIYTTN
ncbi:RNA polymerase sigma factor [Mangrovivirga sp. M17]|uniref:RNA polymerase sigma factor n=1 Tax=Mangrovivirga halotolerans TaxID=2993936 RepID=A0ABT3RNX8_9BACT|nr:RNA polymerase sigma factor [Mangrovivirga halotolerans]MCX2743181.1 RNA polymerase sigma factor [Mangrovivirga halotolerans]